MSNALHDYAKLFEKYAANNGGTGAILAGEDCLALANEMRMDADDIDAENAKLREERDRWHVEQVHAYGNCEDAYKRAAELEAENAKLRELVQYICDECYGDEWFVEKAAALGIEGHY